MTQEEAYTIARKLSNKNYHFVVSTIDKDGYPTSTVLIKLKNKDLNEFYFSTNEESEKIENMKKNPNSCIYCYDPFEYTGITFLGKFHILENSQRQVGLSEDIFPEGLSSRNYVLLKFIPEKIKVYHSLNKIWLDFNEKNLN